jgi:hypothetical protein
VSASPSESVKVPEGSVSEKAEPTVAFWSGVWLTSTGAVWVGEVELENTTSA